MPTLSPTANNQQLTLSPLTNFPQRAKKVVSCLRLRRGFSLIEIVLSLFLVLALLSILFTAAVTFIHSRNSGLQSTAAKIASREIESLRDTNFASLPPSGAISDGDLQKLPSGTATRTVADYQASTKIKQVTIAVNWIENGVPKQLFMDTLISENGL